MRGGRPVGSYGEVARALLDAAEHPGSVRELAQRARVGYSTAKVTCSRLESRGVLAAVRDDARPRVLVRREAPTRPDGDVGPMVVSVCNHDAVAQALQALQARFWGRAAAGPP